MTMSVRSLSLKSSVTQTGLQTISVWQCNLLWGMLGVLIIKDSKDRVTVERRIGNICCLFSCHGHPHENDSLLGTSSSHSHVFVLGLISCTWSFVTSRCWTSKTFELQGTLAPELSG